MSLQRVNRIALDGTTVSVTFGRRQIPCLEASYGDKLEPADITEMGKQEISASTPGSYSCDEVTIKMELATYSSQFAPLLQKDGFGNSRMPIVVTWSHPDLGTDSDLLDACRFVGATQGSVKNDNAAHVMELKFKTTQIYWTNERKTRNQRDLSQPLAASKF